MFSIGFHDFDCLVSVAQKEFQTSLCKCILAAQNGGLYMKLPTLLHFIIPYLVVRYRICDFCNFILLFYIECATYFEGMLSNYLF